MNLYFDTEFTGLHKDTTLISIGFVSETGKTFYAEFTDYDKSQVNSFISENVLSNLLFSDINIDPGSTVVLGSANPTADVVVIGNKAGVAAELTEWMSQFKEINLISDCGWYDMVLLIDLYGSAFDIPEFMSPVYHDINSDISYMYGVTEEEAFDKNREEILLENQIPIPEGAKHNSLYDAKVIKEIYKISQYC